MKIDVSPLVGIGPVRLGMTREEVRTALGEPNYSKGNREGYLSGLFVNFSSNEKVEFIEISKSEEFTAYYCGVPVHDTLAGELIARVSKFSEFDGNDPELGHSYIFKALQLSFWRGTIPSSQDDEDGCYFQAVGVGAPGYFV